MYLSQLLFSWINGTFATDSAPGSRLASASHRGGSGGYRPTRMPMVTLFMDYTCTRKARLDLTFRYRLPARRPPTARRSSETTACFHRSEATACFHKTKTGMTSQGVFVSWQICRGECITAHAGHGRHDHEVMVAGRHSSRRGGL